MEIKQVWGVGNTVVSRTCQVGNHLIASAMNLVTHPVVTGATLISSKVDSSNASWIYEITSTIVTTKNGSSSQLVSFAEF